MDIQAYMDSNRETVLEQLHNFESEKRSPGDDAIPESLEKYLEFVAKTADTLFPWTTVRPLIKKKIAIVIEEFYKQHPNVDHGTPNVPTFNYEEMKNEIVESVDSFYGAPFTIQRICELLTVPYKHYRRTDKFMRGLEKNILVVSYVEPRGVANEASPPPQKRSIFSTPQSYSMASNSPSSSGYVSSGGAGTSGLYGAHHSKAGNSGHSSPTSNASAPLAQLDSFTTAFSSPPSTPLSVVSNMPPYEPTSSSSSSSSGSSAESSPLGPADASPPPGTHFINSHDENLSDHLGDVPETENQEDSEPSDANQEETPKPQELEASGDAESNPLLEKAEVAPPPLESNGSETTLIEKKVETLVELAKGVLADQTPGESVSLTTQKVEVAVEVVSGSDHVQLAAATATITESQSVAVEQAITAPEISPVTEQPEQGASLNMDTEADNSKVNVEESKVEEERDNIASANTDSLMSESDDSEPMDED